MGTIYTHPLIPILRASTRLTGWMTVTAHTGWRMLERGLLTLLAWQVRTRERAHLAALDERMLHDVGLSRADVDNETSKPVWRR